MITRHRGLIMNKVRTKTVLFLRLALPLACMLQAAACASNQGGIAERPYSPPPESRVVLRPGDEIELKFPYWKELNDTQVIRPDGYITLQLIDSVLAQGLTPEELDTKLTNLYESKIKDPVISVVVRSLVDQRIYVGGEIKNPGLLTLQGEVNVLQAVINAGGFKETARTDEVIVIRRNGKGKAVPYKTDLSGTLDETGPNHTFLLQPNDVVYVPKSTIANLNKFVNQYITELFLFRGIGLGFNYELRDRYN
ncbi:MAG: polysaccharide export protein [Proteobacteria bacterium]|nr:polysaccharide export protein [Pseudomonadota bacterium]MBU1739438.1 polysaccharide export protein [Pseudomonadota bacterium]